MVQEKQDVRERMLTLANLTPEQQYIVDVYLREKTEKLRHWERKSGDDNIYVEYLNGTIYLDHLIDDEIETVKKQNSRKKQR